MALGRFLSDSRSGRALLEKCCAWGCEKFVDLVADGGYIYRADAPSLALLIEQDELNADEELVFAAVVRWVKHDLPTRRQDLDVLLPLIRFRLMKSEEPMMAELLFRQHPLALLLMSECHQAAKRGQTDCPRMRARTVRLLCTSISPLVD
eukprot:SAG31_NODE_1540_length_7954_cov_3.521961_5_plen_150_part_00